MKTFLIISGLIVALVVGMGIVSFSSLRSHQNARTTKISYDQGVNYYSFIGTTRFTSPVYFPDLRKTSDWTLDSGPIPLSPDKAAQLSRETLRTLPVTPSDWKVDSINLESIDDGKEHYYLVRYIKNSSPRDEIKIVVFLNGTALTPSKSESEDP